MNIICALMACMDYMRKNKMLFSIIVPVYNVEQYLSECIDSILEQTYGNFELFLVDDGSTDSSGKICDEYKSKDQRITVIHKENGGHISARRAGLEIAGGEYCCFVDSDDYVMNDFLENYARIISVYHPEVIAINATSFNRGQFQLIKNNISEGIYEGSKLQEVKRRLMVIKRAKNDWQCALLNSLCCKCFKRSEKLDYFLGEVSNIINGEDMFCTLCMIDVCVSLYVSQYSGYYYRMNQNSISNTMRTNDFDDAIALTNKLDEYFPDFYNAITGYLKYRIYVYVQIMACNKTHKMYIELMQKKFKDKSIMRRINGFSGGYYNIRERATFFLVKINAWGILWLCKHLKVKIKDWKKSRRM